MEAEVYPDQDVIDTINRNFIPVKAHIKTQPRVFERFKALWTPTQLVLDDQGVERHRIEGFLPVDDYLAQLELGLGKLAFEHSDYNGAEERFESVCESHPSAGAAPEGCYWAGVSRYKATNNAEELESTGKVLRERYPESEWARKASVWVH